MTHYCPRAIWFGVRLSCSISCFPVCTLAAPKKRRSRLSLLQKTREQRNFGTTNVSLDYRELDGLFNRSVKLQSSILFYCFNKYCFPSKFIVFISIFRSVTLPCLDIHYIILLCLIGLQTREVRCVRSDDLTPASANCCGEDLKPGSENLCFE